MPRELFLPPTHATFHVIVFAMTEDARDQQIADAKEVLRALAWECNEPSFYRPTCHFPNPKDCHASYCDDKECLATLDCMCKCHAK